MGKRLTSKTERLMYWHLWLILSSGLLAFSTVFWSLSPSYATSKLFALSKVQKSPAENYFGYNADQLAQNLPAPPVNPEPNPNTDRFLQPAPIPLPTTPQEQRPVLETPPPQTPPNPTSDKFPVRQIEVIDSTILTTAEISAITKPLEGRDVTLAELQSVADEITKIYINRGYITSRAVLVDQTVNNGLVKIRVIEGSVEQIQIEGTRRIKKSFIRNRVQLGISRPLNSNRLEDQLRVMRLNPLFENVEASLRAGSELGKSVLIVRVTESEQFDSNIIIDNYSSPSVGSERAGVNLRYRNISGFGDEIGAAYYVSRTLGSHALDFNYSVPINAMDGTLQLRFAPNFYKVTQAGFREFNITGESNLYEVSFRQPLFRSPRQEFALSVGFNYRESQTFVDGEPTPFGSGPDEEGRTRTSIINFQQEYVSRDLQGATALRSQFSVGTGLFDATINDDDVPDGRFFSWLAQLQRVQRFGKNHLVIIQGDMQLTPNSLLSSQQFVIGGGQSLRGYRQNLRSGDNGFRFSVEDRFTIKRNQNNVPVLQLAPFIDMGTVWNNPDNPNTITGKRFLAGAGIGVLWQPLTNFNLRVDYAVPLISISDKGNNLQDNGLYFQMIYRP